MLMNEMGKGILGLWAVVAGSLGKHFDGRLPQGVVSPDAREPGEQRSEFSSARSCSLFFGALLLRHQVSQVSGWVGAGGCGAEGL